MAYYNGKKVLSVVAVEYLTPNGNIKLTQNGSYDVSAYKKAVVSVFPSGTTQKVDGVGVGLYASLPATALPKGTIDYVGGKTQKVNQICRNPTFATTAHWSRGEETTFSVADNIGTFTRTGSNGILGHTTIGTIASHKLLIATKAKASSSSELVISNAVTSSSISLTADTWINVRLIAETAGTYNDIALRIDMPLLGIGGTLELSDFFVIDLTDIYGAGNEPTSTSDPRIQRIIDFLEQHPEYDEGSFVHAGLSEVLSLDSKGAEANWFLSNLRKTAIVDLGTLNWTKYGDDYISSLASPTPKFVPNDTAMNAVCSSFRVASQYDFEHLGNNVIAMLSSSGSPTFVVYSTDEYADGNAFKSAVSGIYLVYEVAEPLATPTLTPTDILNALGSQYTSYPIPSQVKALDGYGMGLSDNLYNYIDFERKKFVKKVAIVDLGSLDWGSRHGSYSNQFSSTDLVGCVKGNDNILTNVLCDAFPTETWNDMYGHNKNGICIGTDNQFWIRDDTFPDPHDTPAFKEYLSGKYAIFELLVPVETDISEYLDITFTNENLIDTYQGGSVRFENENDLEVPYSITYQYQVE